MKYIIQICFSLGFSFLVHSATAQSINLLPNPGFEEGLAQWGMGIPEKAKSSSAKVEVTGDAPHGGASCAKFSSAEPARYGVTSKPIPVMPGERYRLSAWVRIADDAPINAQISPVYIRATLKDSNKQPIPEPGHIHIGLSGKISRNANVAKNLKVDAQPKGWQKIEGVMEIPPQTASLTPTLMVHHLEGTHICYWDDALVEKVSSTTPLSEELK